ncbi:MAG: hypothetical protein ABIK93_06430 [candidate division WOR-3 bacterium]
MRKRTGFSIRELMKTSPLSFLIWLMLITSQIIFATKYAGDFEEMGVSARAIGLGGACVAVVNDASAIYYNPAAGAKTNARSILLMHCESFGGAVKSNYLGILVPNQNQSYGIAILHNGVPKIKLTTLPDTTQPPSDTNQPILEREVNANQFVFYLNFGQSLSPALHIGVNAKMIYQTYGVASCFGMGIDFGSVITFFDSLDLGLRIRNLTTSPLFWDTKTREVISPHPALGIARRFTIGQDRLLLSVELESNLDEGLTNWQLLENIGVEYSLKRILSARIGLYHQLFTFGLGAEFRGFFVDYAYQTGYFSQARDLGSSQRISGGLKF